MVSVPKVCKCYGVLLVCVGANVCGMACGGQEFFV